MKSASPRRMCGAIAGLFLLLGSSAFAASVVVPTMDLFTHGSVDSSGVFALQTYGDISLEVQGGYKFGGSVTFNIDTNQLEQDLISGTAALSLLSASIVARDLFALPLSITYFVGQNDIFGSGAGFEQFGAETVMTSYRGFLYFPTGPLYDGIYQVQGTGARVELTPSAESFSLDTYVYEDTSPALASLGNYSADVRFLLNFPAIKLEGFVGGTWATANADYFVRGGALFYATNRNVEFLAQIGIPKWQPSVDPVLNVNLFYLLIEPRLHLGVVSIVPTFFWHPGYYEDAYTSSELGSFDVNLDTYLGDATTMLRGGLEENFRFQSSSGVFKFKVSPWIGITTQGVQWTLKINTKLWPFSLTDMIDAFIGVQAEF